MFIFLATFTGNDNPIALNYNSNGDLWIQLPQGPDSDGNKIYLFVNIIDDTYGVTVYNLTQPVIVTPNNNLASQLAASITTNDPNSPFLQDLNSGNVNLVAKNVIALTSVFNIQSISSTNSSSTSSPTDNDQKASLREFLVGKVTELTVSDMSSIKVISSALSTASANTDQLSRNAAVCVFFFRFAFFLMKDNIIYFIKEKTLAKNLEMMNNLNSLSNITTFEDLKQGLNGIADSITNSLIVIYNKK